MEFMEKIRNEINDKSKKSWGGAKQGYNRLILWLDEKRVWIIPVIAGIITIMTLINFSTILPRIRFAQNRADVNENHLRMEMQPGNYDLTNLSRNLQDMVQVLHYEMLNAVYGEDFDLSRFATTSRQIRQPEPNTDLPRAETIIPDDYETQDYDEVYEDEGYDDEVDEDDEIHEDYDYDKVDDEVYDDDDTDIYITSTETNSETQTDYQYLKNQVRNRLDLANIQMSRLSGNQRIEYLAYNHEDGHVISNGNWMLEAIINSHIDHDIINSLQRNFAHVIVVRYNATGRWSVPVLFSADNNSIILHEYWNWDSEMQSLPGIGFDKSISGINTYGYQFDMQNIFHDLTFNNPRNMTFVFAIPHDTFYELSEREMNRVLVPDISNLSENIWWQSREMVASARTIAIALMIIAAALLPFAVTSRHDKAFERLTTKKIPFELLLFATWLSWVFVLNNEWVISNRLSRNQRRLFTNNGILSNSNVQVYYYVILLFIALCFLGYLVTYLKAGFVGGWLATKENSLLYRWVPKLRKGIYEFFTIYLNKRYTLKLLIANLLQMIAALTITINALNRRDERFLVLIAIPAYFLFRFIYHSIKGAENRKNFTILSKIANELAEGNLKTDSSMYLGSYNGIKEKIVTIQDGFAKAVEAAIASERMKGDLITNVSHDLKTPLTSIITYVDLLQTEGLSEEKRASYLETLEMKTDRLKVLIEDLFEVSKATSGNLLLELAEVDVVTLMKQTILGLEDRITAAKIALRENYDDQPIKLMLDGGRMHRVFENLIINIVKYAMPGTRAYIDIQDNEDNVKILLRNISKHEINVDMNDLSQRFVRGEESRTTEGSGLGLSIARSFVELQGGLLELLVDGDLFKVIITFAKN